MVQLRPYRPYWLLWACILTPAVAYPERRLSIGFLLRNVSHHPLLMHVPLFNIHFYQALHGEFFPIPLQMSGGSKETIPPLHQLLEKVFVQDPSVLIEASHEGKQLCLLKVYHLSHFHGSFHLFISTSSSWHPSTDMAELDGQWAVTLNT